MSRTSPPIKGGYSTWVGSGKAGQDHAGDARIRLKAGERVGYLWLRNPVPKKRTVEDAPLRLFVDQKPAGPVTLRIKRLAEKFSPQDTTWATRPSTVDGTTIEVTDTGPVFEFEVPEHLQAGADGDPWLGWEISTTSDDPITIKSPQADIHQPMLRATWSTAPRQPVDLKPSHGAVSVTHPVVRSDFEDTSGSTRCAGMRVRVYSDEDQTDLIWDSGRRATNAPQLDLADPALGFPGIPANTDRWWTSTVKDGDNKWSEESAPALLRYRPLPTVTIGFADTGFVGYAGDYTPVFGWNFPGQQDDYRVLIHDATGVEVYDSERIPSATARSHAIPAGVLRQRGPFVGTVRVGDDEEREAVPGAPMRAVASMGFEVIDNPTGPAPTGLTVEDNSNRPGPVLTWHCTTPDSFVIERDGVPLVWELDPADAAAGTPDTWVFADLTAGSSNHTYTVRAVFNGYMSEGPTVGWENTGTHGVWVGAEWMDTWLRLTNSTPSVLAMSDDKVTHKPLGSRRDVTIVTARRGYQGTITGTVEDDWDGYTAEDGLAACKAIKNAPAGTEFRYVAGRMNIGVEVFDMSPVEEDDSTVDNARYRVTFNVSQVSGWWDQT